MNLDRVTVTGADDSTDVDELLKLSLRFPFVEWGILMSASQEGGPRFPSRAWMGKLLDALNGAAFQHRDVQLAGHLCGSWLRMLFTTGSRAFAARLPLGYLFDRIQLNTHAQHHDYNAGLLLRGLSEWRHGTQFIFQRDGVNDEIFSIVRAMAQTRHPSVDVVQLSDLSHGAGLLPDEWPPAFGDYIGYAGGLSPDNLETELFRIAAAAGEKWFWIDAETHVRSSNGLVFDLGKVQRFLEIAEPHVVVRRSYVNVDDKR